MKSIFLRRYSRIEWRFPPRAGAVVVGAVVGAARSGVPSVESVSVRRSGGGRGLPGSAGCVAGLGLRFANGFILVNFMVVSFVLFSFFSFFWLVLAALVLGGWALFPFCYLVFRVLCPF
ncbi:hypothetical protein F4861DRAFT_508213 [Xylaria intraflava]|nr:hypothetical protein F4861DRAFT_508213 [Xylaria intraflava]